jgi:septal ring factor EnvC (AmiA/AmiB activator)
VAKNRLIWIAVALAFSLLLAGCGEDDKRELQAQVEQQQTQIEQLQDKIDELTQLHDQAERAASIYEGCMALDGLFSQVCPESVMVEGKAAVEDGYVGGGWQYWTAYAAKLCTFLIAASLASLSALWLWLKWIEPSAESSREARKTIETAQQQAAAAQREAAAAESQKWRTEQEIAEAQRNLAQVHQQLDALRGELDELEREIEEKRKDLDLLGGFS